MTGPYTYLIGLFIFGVILGTVGLLAAARERQADANAAKPVGRRDSSAHPRRG